jgi:hypothetical protein
MLSPALFHGVICPTGCLAESLSSPSAKNISLRGLVETPLSIRYPASIRGAYASSRTLGAGCDGRGSGARRATLKRTAKSCGPGAPTLASSFAEVSAGRRWQTSPVTGESTKETVKTIAQGRPGVSGEPVVTTLVCLLHFAREAAGAHGAPGFPCALFLLGEWFLHNSGASRRESAVCCVQLFDIQ